MEDVEILKRMAEIEGYEGLISEHGVTTKGTNHWNPLTRWPDLGPLIEKYRLQIEPPSKFEEDCFSIRELWTVCAYDSNDGAKSESLPHAICLAIIEANGGMGDE